LTNSCYKREKDATGDVSTTPVDISLTFSFGYY